VDELYLFFTSLLIPSAVLGRDDVLPSPTSPSELAQRKSERLKIPESPPSLKSPPQLNLGSSLSLPDPFRRRPTLRRLNTGSSSNSSGSLRAPDRFLPTRSPLEPAFHNFQASKDSEKLSNNEKLLRCDIASLDAFRPRGSATNPTSSTLPAAAQLFGGAQLGSRATFLTRIDSL
jgi:hypothetical protein